MAAIYKFDKANLGINPDFALAKSAPSDSEGPHGQIRREFGRLCGVSPLEIAERFQGLSPGNVSHFTGQILRLHKKMYAKSGITLRSRQNPRRILSRNPFGANFACRLCRRAKFGINDYSMHR